MSNKAHGYIRKQDDMVVGEFNLKGKRLLAQIDLPSLAEHPIVQFPVTLEYDNADDLKGSFKIGDDSVVGPEQLRLSLKSESDKEAKITGIVYSPLPSGLSNRGAVIFNL
ncbi:hypothetical protein GQ42DRAFT_159771 [Ramicandelaber brevisporus]|nr:hypothetical protein GQ42DRAFT_159771 [Ramicandelaber brevisporus]